MEKIITKIEKQTKRDRYNIYLDGVYGFSLSAKTLNDIYLKKDDILSEKDMEKAKKADEENKIFERALHILSYRAHSRKELTEKLHRKFDKAVVDEVILRVENAGFINDVDFTERYVQQSKKGKKIVRLELIKKGIDKDLIEKFIIDKDDESELENAQRIADKVLKKYMGESEQFRKQKLYENLTRKGFSYDIYNEIILENNLKK